MPAAHTHNPSPPSTHLAAAAKAYIRSQGAPIVVKASGLAAGKGVIVASSTDEACAAVDLMLLDNAFGDAGASVGGGCAGRVSWRWGVGARPSTQCCRTARLETRVRGCGWFAGSGAKRWGVTPASLPTNPPPAPPPPPRPPGSEVVVEEFLDGEEASFFALVDGEAAVALASAQDHKAVGDGDTGAAAA